MNRRRGALLLLAIAILAPSCGGGGGGGGGLSFTPPADNGRLAALPLVDTSTPAHTVDTTQPAGTVLTQLQSFLTAGGITVFNNVGAYSLTVTATLTIPNGVTSILDGGAGGPVTLTGSPGVRIMSKGGSANLTVQRLTFSGASFPSSGAAINGPGQDGSFSALNCIFTTCKTTSTGPDIGGGAFRMINQHFVQVSGCTFTDCDGSNGGAINSLGNRLTIIDSTFTNCDAFGTGGGADQGPTGQGGIGGAVYIDGVHQHADVARLDVSGCTFTTNTANDHGGAIFAYTYPNTGSESVFDTCTFNSNKVLDTAAAVGFGGAIYQQEGGVAVRRSTFKTNTSTHFGGAMWTSCAMGIFENCTFQGNRTEGWLPAGSCFGGALTISGTILINGVTISGNHAGDWGGGIFTGSASTVTLMNSILDRNTGTFQYTGWNSNATLVDGGNNLQFPVNKPPFVDADVPATASVIFADALLLTIGSNGGPTQTMALSNGSPAINAGNAATAPTVDQRGNARVGNPDLGSYEHP